MSERQCHLPCGVSELENSTTYRPFFAREKIFIPEEGNIDDEGGVT